MMVVISGTNPAYMIGLTEPLVSSVVRKSIRVKAIPLIPFSKSISTSESIHLSFL